MEEVAWLEKIVMVVKGQEKPLEKAGLDLVSKNRESWGRDNLGEWDGHIH